jgi:predicted lipid-binding transport protein (Tim44 family)
MAIEDHHDRGSKSMPPASRTATKAARATGTKAFRAALSGLIGGFAMRTFFGMILGALILGIGVYMHDSMATSTVANGQTAQERRTIVNWDVAQTNWEALKARTKEDWAKLTAQMKS